MANQYINAMTAVWNSIGTTYSAIKMNITNAASSGSNSPRSAMNLMSKLIQLQVGTVDQFVVDKFGNMTLAGDITSAGMASSAAITPVANDGASLGTSVLSWSDLYLASGGVINWNAGDVTVTHVTNRLDFGGASAGYTFDSTVRPSTDDVGALGSIVTGWSDLFLASGGVLNWANGNVILGNSASGVLTLAPGDLRITTPGTNSASVVTVGGAQTLTNKTMTSPLFGSSIQINNGAKVIELRVTAAGTLEIYAGAVLVASLTETGNLYLLGTARLTGNVSTLGQIQANGDIEAFAGIT